MKLITVFTIIIFASIFSTSIVAMDFGDDDTGMSFGEDEVKTDTTKDKKDKKNKDDNSKTDDAMSFGDESDGGDGGMSFGEEDVGGMDFTGEDVVDDGTIKKDKADKMEFTLKELDKEIKTKKTVKKKEKIKIVKKPRTYIEKGVYFKLSYGIQYLLSPKIDSKEYDESSLIGSDYRIGIGFDVNKDFSIDIFTNFISQAGQIKGGQDNILYDTDLNIKVFSVGFNYNVMNKDRINFHINLHGGALLVDSSLDMDGINFAGGALLGFEYYLLLRHFSVSVYSSFDYFTGIDTMGISAAASLKYSF